MERPPVLFHGWQHAGYLQPEHDIWPKGVARTRHRFGTTPLVHPQRESHENNAGHWPGHGSGFGLVSQSGYLAVYDTTNIRSPFLRCTHCKAQGQTH